MYNGENRSYRVFEGIDAVRCLSEWSPDRDTSVIPNGNTDVYRFGTTVSHNREGLKKSSHFNTNS